MKSFDIPSTNHVMTTSPAKTFKQRFVEISEHEINLKFLFDHVKNYMICAVVFAASGRLLFQGITFTGIPYLGVISGGLLFLVAFALFLLNVSQGMLALRAFMKSNPASSWIAFITLTMFGSLLAFVFMEFLGAQIGAAGH